jgi:choline dehydrogenase
MDQLNITVLTGALAARLRFAGNRATGIDFLYNGKTVRAQATREVILSLGAIHTPKLLMQSGIGDEMELTNAGIALLHALPGVGRNLHDHVAFGCVWENAGKPSPQIPRSQTSCFWKTRGELEAPNIYVYSHGGPDFSPENAARFKPPATCWSLSGGMRPNSRGIIHLTGSDPADPVSIDTNYLDDPQDLRDLIAGLSFHGT